MKRPTPSPTICPHTNFPPFPLFAWVLRSKINSESNAIACHSNRTDSPHFRRQQVIAHLGSKEQRTDTQKLEIQERRNALARRIRLWKTAQSVYMPQVSDEQDHLASNDQEFDETKPELWPLFLPSHLTQDDRSSCHKGVAELERVLRLAQAQDSLVDLRRLRRTL